MVGNRGYVEVSVQLLCFFIRCVFSLFINSVKVDLLLFAVLRFRLQLLHFLS